MKQQCIEPGIESLAIVQLGAARSSCLPLPIAQRMELFGDDLIPRLDLQCSLVTPKAPMIRSHSETRGEFLHQTLRWGDEQQSINPNTFGKDKFSN